MDEAANPQSRRSVIDDLEATSRAVQAADDAHLQGLWDPQALAFPAQARSLADRRPELESAA